MQATNDINVDEFVDVAASTIGISIPPETRPGVIASFRQIAAMADLVMSFPLEDDLDPAPVFQP